MNPPAGRGPESGDSDAETRGTDFGLADLQPTLPRRPSASAVGPADVADSVKEVLRAAFDSSPKSTPPPDATEDASRGRRRRKPPSLELDETGPVDVPEDGAPEHRSSPPDPDASQRTRRKFLDIAREHDTRIKAAASAETSDSAVVPPSAETVARKAKKRVVITDEEVLSIKRAAPKEERTRKKTRRSADGISRLPNRRWWTRTADGRWRLRWYSIVGVVVVVVIAVLLLLTSPLLSIRSIVVEGNVYTNQTSLDEVLGRLKGEAILTADLHGATRQIETIPWVRKARISMHLPSRIVVQIDEREPLAYFRAVDGFIRVLDREGRVLDVIEGDPVDYVRIIGSGPNLAAGDFVGQPLLGVVDLLGALPASLAERLVSATVSPEGQISVQLTPNLSIIFGQPTDFQVKLVAVVNEIKRQGSRTYTIIDVSTGEPNVR